MNTVNRTHHFSDGAARIAARLVVHRHTMYPRAFCLSWDFGDDTSVGAEGECSRQLFRTEGAARAYGERRYGERPVRASW